MQDDPILRFILFFTFGGLVVSVLAGTSLAGERRRWWTVALLVAVAGGVANLWLPASVDSEAGAGLSAPDSIGSALLGILVLVYYPCVTLAVAWAGRIGFSNGWPGLVRVVVCLLTDFTVRWGTTIGFLLLLCYYSVDCDP